MTLVRALLCSLADLAVQAINISERDIGNLDAAKGRDDLGRVLLPVCLCRRRSLARQVLGDEAVAEIGNGRSLPPGLNIAQRIAATINLLGSSLASVRAAPVDQSGNEPMVKRRRRPTRVR